MERRDAGLSSPAAELHAIESALSVFGVLEMPTVSKPIDPLFAGPVPRRLVVTCLHGPVTATIRDLSIHVISGRCIDASACERTARAGGVSFGGLDRRRP